MLTEKPASGPASFRFGEARNRRLARGLVNYGADEARRIRGLPSDRIEAVLGYVDEPELIHRDNLILID